MIVVLSGKNAQFLRDMKSIFVAAFLTHIYVYCPVCCGSHFIK